MKSRVADEGLKSSDRKQEPETFTDSSFAPHGLVSQGCVGVMWNQAPMLCKSGRQPFRTFSTAESELLELTERLSMADAFNALTIKHEENYDGILHSDNAAAATLVSEPSGGR